MRGLFLVFVFTIVMVHSSPFNWIWAGGKQDVFDTGNFSAEGVVNPNNLPPARHSSAYFYNPRRNTFYIFGGRVGKSQYLNDLWRFVDNKWVWMHSPGSNYSHQHGVWGTRGMLSPYNVPSARYGMGFWISRGGDLFVFGGKGIPINKETPHSTRLLNDLWVFDIRKNQWAWLSGERNGDNNGIYTKGASSIPGARVNPISWTDRGGNLWLFGGRGFGETGKTTGFLNDLWYYNRRSKTWNFFRGSREVNVPGSFGTKRRFQRTNMPGAREGSTTWIDRRGRLWLFGGFGVDAYNSTGLLNDLWLFNGTQWAWIGGSERVNASTEYGIQYVGNRNTNPGGRMGAFGWIDQCDNKWLYGGSPVQFGKEKRIIQTIEEVPVHTLGIQTTETVPPTEVQPALEGKYFGDLWKFDGRVWTWVSGFKGVNISPTFGPMGMALPMSNPGMRASAASFRDRKGNFWFFGGKAADGVRNDMWTFSEYCKIAFNTV